MILLLEFFFLGDVGILEIEYDIVIIFKGLIELEKSINILYRLVIMLLIIMILICGFEDLKIFWR